MARATGRGGGKGGAVLGRWEVPCMRCSCAAVKGVWRRGRIRRRCCCERWALRLAPFVMCV